MKDQPRASNALDEDRPPDLPEYDRPPLVEVVLSAQFPPLQNMTVAHFGLYWARVRHNFPDVDVRGPLPRSYEALDAPRAQDSRVSFAVADRPPTPRLWFLKADGSELIQMQEDRFIHNWRKAGPSGEYPRYERIRQAFMAELAEFQSCVVEENLGNFVPDQVEVTYVNHIVAGDGWADHSEVDRVFSRWSPKQGAADLEDARFGSRYILRSDQPEPFGRLHLNVKPARRSEDGVPIFVMELTARGRPLGEPTVEGVLAFMNAGRNAIVRTYTAETTPEMHEHWGRSQ